MFYQNCGTELPDNADFCKSCGKKVIKADGAISIDSIKEDVLKSYEKIKEKSQGTLSLEAIKDKAVNSNKNTKIIVLAIVAVIIVILVLRGCLSLGTSGGGNSLSGGASSYEGIIDEYFSTAFNKDVEGHIKCFPPEMASDLERQYTDYRSTGYSMNPFSFVDRDESLKFSYTIQDKSELSGDEVEEINNTYGIKMKEGYSVEVKVSYEEEAFDGTVKQSQTKPLKVGKINNKWYVVGAIEGLSIWSP